MVLQLWLLQQIVAAMTTQMIAVSMTFQVESLLIRPYLMLNKQRRWIGIGTLRRILIRVVPGQSLFQKRWKYPTMKIQRVRRRRIKPNSASKEMKTSKDNNSKGQKKTNQVKVCFERYRNIQGYKIKGSEEKQEEEEECKRNGSIDFICHHSIWKKNCMFYCW